MFFLYLCLGSKHFLSKHNTVKQLYSSKNDILKNSMLVQELELLMFENKISSAAQSCPTLCDPMDCSTPGFLVLHHLLELTQTHVHQVGDAIQPSHLLSSPSPPAFNLSHYQGLFQWVSSSHQVAKVLEFQHQSLQWIFRTDFLRIDWFDLHAVQGTLKNLLQTTVQKHQFCGTQLSLWSNSHIHMWLLEKPYLWLDRPLSAKSALIGFSELFFQGASIF